MKIWIPISPKRKYVVAYIDHFILVGTEYFVASQAKWSVEFYLNMRQYEYSKDDRPTEVMQIL